MMALTLLLRLDFLPGGNHHHKKGMNAPSKLDGLNLVGTTPTLASSVGNERTKDVNTLQKSIVNYGRGGLFCSKEESSLDRQIQPNKGTTSTRVSKKMRRNKRSHLLDAFVERQSRMLEILSARLGPAATTHMLEQPSQLSR
ncbi:hypothetical protein AAG906_035530 [Vitis piasezkii]